MFLCFAEGLCSMFCIGPMRWTKKGSHYGHANAATTACICAGVGSSLPEIPRMQESYFRLNIEGVNEVEELEEV